MGWEGWWTNRISAFVALHAYSRPAVYQPDLRQWSNRCVRPARQTKFPRAPDGFFLFFPSFFNLPLCATDRCRSLQTKTSASAGVLVYYSCFGRKSPDDFYFFFWRCRGLRKRAAIKALRLTSVPRPLGRRIPCPACRYIRSSREPVLA